MGKLGSLCQRHKRQHPHHVKVSPWGRSNGSHFVVSNDLLGTVGHLRGASPTAHRRARVTTVRNRRARVTIVRNRLHCHCASTVFRCVVEGICSEKKFRIAPFGGKKKRFFLNLFCVLTTSHLLLTFKLHSVQMIKFTTHARTHARTHKHTHTCTC